MQDSRQKNQCQALHEKTAGTYEFRLIALKNFVKTNGDNAVLFGQNKRPFLAATIQTYLCKCIFFMLYFGSCNALVIGFPKLGTPGWSGGGDTGTLWGLCNKFQPLWWGKCGDLDFWMPYLFCVERCYFLGLSTFRLKSCVLLQINHFL